MILMAVPPPAVGIHHTNHHQPLRYITERKIQVRDSLTSYRRTLDCAQSFDLYFELFYEKKMFRTVSKKSRKSHNFAYEQCNNFSSYFTRTFKHGLYTMYSLLLCILLILAVAQACRFMLGWESTLQFFEQIAHFFVSKRAICS